MIDVNNDNISGNIYNKRELINHNIKLYIELAKIWYYFTCWDSIKLSKTGGAMFSILRSSAPIHFLGVKNAYISKYFEYTFQYNYFSIRVQFSLFNLYPLLPGFNISHHHHSMVSWYRSHSLWAHRLSVFVFVNISLFLISRLSI